MRRFPSSPRHRPIARDQVAVIDEDDLATWGNTSSVSTMALPGTSANIYSLVVDVTRALNVSALADVGGLRFRHESGVRLTHKRSPGGRIFLIGNFHGGINSVDYFWGKSGATQPGIGFQSADEALSVYRIGVIFEGNAPVDLTPNPASFLLVGAPTIETYELGQAMKFYEGSHIEVTDAKVRSSARNSRAIFVSITLSSATEGGRVVSWYNRLTNQRGYQLWMRSDGLEFYVSDNGTSFQRWLLLGQQKAGANSIGASWTASIPDALMLCNDLSEIAPSDFGVTAGPIFDSSEVYIIGGTKIPGEFFGGTIRALFERFDDFESPEHFQTWRLAWDENDTFWGIADRTPDNLDVPDLSSVPLSSEVAFATNEITGITSGTSISVDGPGTPTFSVGSTFSTIADLKAKGSTSGTVNSGNWVATYHNSASANLTVRESTLTVGTVTSPRRSTTIAAGGGSYTPGGPANYNVTSVSGLVSAFNSASAGQIIEIAPGDYFAQGQLLLKDRDFRGGAPVEIRSATLGFRGYLPSEGGLHVPGETKWQSGSGGSEFSSIFLRNVHNVILTGLRTYQGKLATADKRACGINCISCNYITFQYFKWCGWKPDTALNTWATDIHRPDNGWWNIGRGMQMGINGRCTNMTIKKSLIHYQGDIGVHCADTVNTVFEDCVFTDQMSDHIRNDGANSNFTARRCIFYRTWGVKSADGGIAHMDALQNTTKTQSGWQNHKLEDCIFSSGDSGYPHMQCIFYECDNYPAYPAGDILKVTNCFVDCRAPNAIYSRPGNHLTVTNTTVLQSQFGGLNIMNAAGTDSLLDTVWSNPNIQVDASTGNGLSFGNNIIDRCVYYTSDFGNTPGDQIINSTSLLKTSYAAELEDFPVYNGPIRSSGVPALPLMSAAAFKPLRLINTSGVFVPSELIRAAPKSTSTIHPNQKGIHYGCSALFQTLGALP